MHIGYILYDEHPLLLTIQPQDIVKFIGNKPILIVGLENALSLYPELKLDSKTIDDQNHIYYCFSIKESEEKYKENLENFINNCFNTYFSDYEIQTITQLKKIREVGDKVFIYENNNLFTLTTLNKIYYINKEIFNFFNKIQLSKALINGILLSKNKNVQIISWNKYNYFGAYLRSYNCYKSLYEIKKTYKQFKQFDLYLGAFCLNWLEDLEKTNIIDSNEFSTWMRAYDIEHKLSTVRVKLNVELLKKYSSIDTNTLAKTIYANCNGNYVKQNYNGTDKITGRMYVSDNSFTLQTLPPKFQDIVIAEPNCLLVEIDYDYFEFSLLSQLTNLNIIGDPHTYISNLIFGTSEQRTIAKSINYGLLYGQALKNILKSIYDSNNEVKISEKELTEKLQNILLSINDFKVKLEKQYKENSYIINHFNRKIYPEKPHAVLNNFVQSTAADFFIVKLEKIFNLLQNYNSINTIVLQKHDSVLFNLSIKDIEETDMLENINEILLEEEKGLSATYGLKYGKNWKVLK